MAYNHRMSMAGSQQQHNRGRKKEDDNDALMRLVSPALDLAEDLNLRHSETAAHMSTARQRDRRMYQRHRYPVHRSRLGQTKPPADPDGLRMVCRASHEYYARDGRTGYACSCRRYLRRLPRYRPQ